MYRGGQEQQNIGLMLCFTIMVGENAFKKPGDALIEE
jgi:hypothetical protein